MRSIGGRLGHVDTIELSEGRMLIDVDSRRPLKFKRKVESPEGDAVTIEIKNGRLFKHCTIALMRKVTVLIWNLTCDLNRRDQVSLREFNSHRICPAVSIC